MAKSRPHGPLSARPTSHHPKDPHLSCRYDEAESVNLFACLMLISWRAVRVPRVCIGQKEPPTAIGLLGLRDGGMALRKPSGQRTGWQRLCPASLFGTSKQSAKLKYIMCSSHDHIPLTVEDQSCYGMNEIRYPFNRKQGVLALRKMFLSAQPIVHEACQARGSKIHWSSLKGSQCVLS